MKIAIVYSSVHHQNTKKIVEGIKEKVEVDLIKAQEAKTKDLREYDIIGIASGIYMGKCHEQVLDFIQDNKALTVGKKVFLIITSGSNGKKYGLEEKKMLESKDCNFLGMYKCKGYDTYGIFKLFGGIAKGHPDDKDIEEAVSFINKLTK